MAVEVIKWNKAITMTKAEIIKFQVMVICHIRKIKISAADLECLGVLGQKGVVEYNWFCDYLSSERIFQSPQSSRNALSKLTDKKILLKSKDNRKMMIAINPELQIQGVGNILVDVKCFSPIKDLAVNTIIDGTN